MQRHYKSYPWEEGESFLYYIQDMAAPKDADSFKMLISWLADQLVAGKKVHIGCIGGHGRTGTVLAALVKFMTGMEDAITYVRENYCHKAVESSEQISFLSREYGIKPAQPTKGDFFGGSGVTSGRTSATHKVTSNRPQGNLKKKDSEESYSAPSSSYTVKACKSPHSIWGNTPKSGTLF